MASLEEKRHTLAHLLAAAIIDLYRKDGAQPQLAIGPAIDNGFYYDIDFGGDTKPSEDDLPRIEKKMREILKTWGEMDGKKVDKDFARQTFSSPNGANPYKSELIDEIAGRGEDITLYTAGNFTDLCRGGHAENPSKEIAPDSFMLDRIAGAYWRGDEKNQMLTRIYGLAFDTKEELDAYKTQIEEAKKRDHRKLGAELKLFTLSSLVGAGLPLLQPKGAMMRREIEDYLWQLHQKLGYNRVYTPHIAKEQLYVTSGHAEKFGDELFRVSGKEEKFILKPMNCPHHMQIFADNQFSYRDMPVRYFEPATVYRDEKTGQLAGLTRVRSITQDDGHLFCRPSQIGEEVGKIVNVIKEFYNTMDMLEGYWVRLSLRGPEGKYLGSDEVWEKAEKALRDAADENELPYKVGIDEAAFYGPKLDFIFKDAIGREWQLATIQCDFNLPERFDLSYINEEGAKERPVVIHRAISGSLERFMGVAIEHFAGAFPLWLSPVQVKVLSVSEKTAGYAKQVYEELKSAGIRTELDDSNESLGKKIRAAKTEKVWATIVVGEKEAEAKTITAENNRNGDKMTAPLADFIEKLKARIAKRTND